MRYLSLAIALTWALLLGGCNKKTESEAGGKPDETAGHDQAREHRGASDAQVEKQQDSVDPEAAAQALAATATPDQVVLAFLEATRRGDEVLASQLLSKKALEETTKAGLIVKPPGTPSMQYEIGEVEYPSSVANGAYVQSIWRERFDDGEDRFDITWVLRKQPEGWRIVGMALPGDDLVNFEQPDALRQKMDESLEESESTDATSLDGESEDAEGENSDNSTAGRLSTPPKNLR